MPIINEIAAALEEFAPLSGACGWDNVGLLVGDGGGTATAVLVSLDIDGEVVGEAVAKRAELIVTHHPVIFGGIKDINTGTEQGRLLQKLIRNGISVYSAHTNLDSADGGTSDALFETLGLDEKEILTFDGIGLGRAGRCRRGLPLREYSGYVKAVLDAAHIKWAGEPDMIIKKVGLAAGTASGMKYFDEAVKAGCDCYITGDVSFHEARDAAGMGLGIIDAGHFATEIPVVGALCGFFEKISERNSWGLTVHRAVQRDIFN